MLAGGATNNLANAGSGLSATASAINSVGNMNIVDNRPPPPPHSSVLHMSGNNYN